MIVIICGSRVYSNVTYGFKVISEFHAETPIELVIEGGMTGADQIGRNWARRNGIKHTTMRADWKRYGNRAAGPIRNSEMLKTALEACGHDLARLSVIAFKGGKGTADMVRKARAAGVTVHGVVER